MSTELSTRRDYLGEHRRLIVGRAIAATLVGTVPVPLLESYLVAQVLASGYRRIANDRHVHIDRAGINHLVHGPTAPASWIDMATGALAFRLAAKAAKRMLLAVAAARRAQAASRTFVAMTLFDHYCARIHVGIGISADDALALRTLISRAIDSTPGSLSFEPFRRGALAAARATLRAPLELADIASRGWVRKLLDRSRDPQQHVLEGEDVTSLDLSIDQALADDKNFLARAVTAVELGLNADVNPYFDAVIRRFEDLWRAHVMSRTLGELHPLTPKESK